MRNLLATRWGRLTAFFFLYVTEGIPLGFTAVAMAAQMRRQGIGPAAIGTFVASLYLPWSWKWAMGPVVDLVYSDRLGRRRAWIVACQVMMAATLLMTLPYHFPMQLAAITTIILIHNVFAATQDVAIDALACTTLDERERGLANGLMFAGAYLGNAIGGSGVLFLVPHVGFDRTFLFVAGMILAVTVFISLWLKEPKVERFGPIEQAPRPHAVLRELRQYLMTVLRAFFGSRPAFLGLLFALLPTGAYALSLALQSNLAVELGLSDSEIAWLNLFSTVLAALGCVIGGILSDRYGRRRTIAIYVVTTAIPTVALAMLMQHFDWIMPIDPRAPDRPQPTTMLLTSFWTTTLVYSFLQGLMYGTRTALFMDLCLPEVAATQFTAYMSLLNLVIAYSAWWQGAAIEAFGYPTTLLLDGSVGCLSILLLPWMTRRADRDHTPIQQEPRG